MERGQQLCEWKSVDQGVMCRYCGAVRPFPRARTCSSASTLRTTPLGDNKYHHACPRCDFETITDGPEEITHDCHKPERIVRLGERVESALRAAGITEDSYRRWKETLGLPPTCSCAERKAWLDKADKTLRLGEKLAAFKSLMGW